MRPAGLPALLGMAVSLVAQVPVSDAATSAGSEMDRRAVERTGRPPLGLPPIPLPEANPPTASKIRLGRKLFFDRRLSSNGTLSCGMCHVPEQGFTVNEIRTAVGNQGTSLRRNAPTLLNTAYHQPSFHDGREPSLDLQPFDVFLNPDEMAQPSLGAVVQRVRSLADYGPLFDEAFGGPATVERIGWALASYERTLLAADSPFDRWHFGGDEGAVEDGAKRGFALFDGKAGCTTCHLVADDHALFTDGKFHDTGVGWHNSTVRIKNRDPVTVELIPGMKAQLPVEVLESVGEPFANDLGRYEVTGDAADRWKFKTPSLRNVALTSPYMHDGTYATLREVVEFYDRGTHPHEGLDPALQPLGLLESEIDEIVAFLESLTGNGIDEIVRDARSQSVGNPGD